MDYYNTLLFDDTFKQLYTPNIVSIILTLISTIIIIDHLRRQKQLQQQQLQQKCNNNNNNPTPPQITTTTTTTNNNTCNCCSSRCKKNNNSNNKETTLDSFGDESFDNCVTPTSSSSSSSLQYKYQNGATMTTTPNHHQYLNASTTQMKQHPSPPSNSSSPQPYSQQSSSFLSPLNYITGSSKCESLEDDDNNNNQQDINNNNNQQDKEEEEEEEKEDKGNQPTSSIPPSLGVSTDSNNIFGGGGGGGQDLSKKKKKMGDKSKKNQSYFVSTYYSKYEVPKETSFTVEPVEEQENDESESVQFDTPPQKNPTSSIEFEELDISKQPPTTTTTTATSKTIKLIQPTNPSNMTQAPLYLPNLLYSSVGNAITESPSSIRSLESLSLSSSTSKSITKRKKTCILPQILHLKWKTSIKKVLVIHKFHDMEVLRAAKEVGAYLNELGIQTVCESEQICECPTARSLEEISDPFVIDFIVSLGGDGTILHTSSLFKTYMPPIISFNMGSLGFLTTFEPDNWKEHIKNVIDGKCFVSYRLRLACTVVSKNESNTYQVLNEVSIDRGNNPYLSHLECLCDDKPITVVQADGLIIATSTGSTAYSLSAGGSLVHPAIPAMLITPICPHTLSFRPVLLPSTSTLIIRVPETSRCSAWASFDGKNRHEIKQGDYVVISTSKWAVPVICKTDENGEWFEKLANNLNWNTRTIQKSFQSSSPPTFSTTNTSLLPSPSL
ncbi:NAD+ kinase family protein [Cavenderia fasciculata]|uniref:NAD+ kinase family protein n=1 Tax=Cavenderia fasciculata TaxID=261658 RepID=F4QA14_CACFS|nr:NAD+ kinase family protein [Cavenderia fasciculata]EGG15533.1 NAD+ kinase family protein [Cavenderia fasciculata]|eukprot:XP_004354275.1 NAD+ kinase family protein [Cavenderia fasciculata]